MSRAVCSDGLEIDYVCSTQLHTSSVLYRRYIRRRDTLLQFKKMIGKDHFVILAIDVPDTTGQIYRGYVVFHNDVNRGIEYGCSSVPREVLFRKDVLGRIADFLGVDWINFLVQGDRIPSSVVGSPSQRHMERDFIAPVITSELPEGYSFRRILQDEFLSNPELHNRCGEMLLRAAQEEIALDFTATQTPTVGQNFILGKLQDPRHYVYGVFKGKDEHPVAVTVVHRDTDHTGTVCGFAVAPDVSRQGIGTAILTRTLHASSFNFKTVGCVVVENNVASKKIMERAGLKTYAITVSTPRLHNGIQPTHRGGQYPVYYSNEDKQNAN